VNGVISADGERIGRGHRRRAKSLRRRSRRLERSLIERYFTGTASRIEGVSLAVLAREALIKHQFAMQPPGESETELRVGGEYQYRVRGERHLLNPTTVSKLQQAVRTSKFEMFQEFAAVINQQNRDLQPR